MRIISLAIPVLALSFVLYARPGFASYDVTGADAVIGVPDLTSDGIRFLDPVDRTATVTVDKVIGVISATPPLSVSTALNNTGILVLQGNTTVNGDIGATGAALLRVDAGAAGTASVFAGDVNAVTTNITSTGSATFNGDLNSALSYDGAGVVVLGDNSTIAGNVTNDTGADGRGTLTLDDRGTVLGQVGGLGASLLAVNAGADASTSTFFSDVYTQTMNITGDGVVLLNGDLVGDLSYADNGVVRLTGSSNLITGDVTNDTGSDEQGTLTFDTSVVVLGRVGAKDESLLAVNAGANGSSVTLSGDVHAVNTNITGTGVLVVDGDLYGTLSYDDDGTVILASDNTIYGVVTNNTGTNGQGTLTLDGSGTVTEQVGASGAALLEVNAGENGTSSIFESDVYAQDTNVTGTGTVTLSQVLYGALNYDADGLFVLENGAMIMGDVTNGTVTDGQGTLTLEGSGAVYGLIGDEDASLRAVNAGANGSSSTFANHVYAQVVNVTGTGVVSFNGDLNGALSYDADGIVALMGNAAVTGPVTNDTGIDERGALAIFGNMDILGQVGAAGASLRVIAAGANGTSSSFASDVYTQVMNIAGTGNVTLNGDLNGALSYNEDGTATLGDGTAITGTVTNDTGTDGRGVLAFDGGGMVLFQVGAAGASLRAVNAGAGGEVVSFMSDVYAQTMNITGTGTVALNADLSGSLSYDADGTMILADGMVMTGAVTNDTLADGQGTLTLAGSATMSAQIGALDAALKAVNAGADAEAVTFMDDVHTQSMNITGTGSVVIDGDLYGALSYMDDGVVTISDGMEIMGAVSNDSGSSLQGELNLVGTHTTGDTIGIVGGNALRRVAITQGTFTMAHDMAAGVISVDQGATFVVEGDRVIADGDLVVGSTGGPSVDLGQNMLTLSNGGVDFAAGSSINLTVSDTSTYGRIVQAAADAVVNLGTVINVNISGYVPHGTVLTVIDGSAGSGVAGGLTVLDNDMIVSFIVSAVAGPDLILTVFVDYDPADYGGSTAAVAEALAVIEGQDVSADMRAIFMELHNAPTVQAVSHAVTQMRPYEGTAVVDETNSLSSNGHRAAMAHLGAVRNNGGKTQEVLEREAIINSALDEYDAPVVFDENPDRLIQADIWVQGISTDTDQDAHDGVEGYSAMAHGIIMGVDLLKLENMIFGFAGGFAMDEIEPDQFGIGTIDIDHYPLILYAELHGIRPWRIDAALSVARNQYESERMIRFGSIDRTAKSAFDGEQYSFYVEGAYDLVASSFKFTPSVALDYSYMSLDGYTETGADALNLKVEPEDYSHLRSGLGLAASTSWMLDRVRVIPQVYGKGYHEWLEPSIQSTASFSGTATTFQTMPMESSRDTVETGMSLEFVMPREMSLTFNYDAEYSQDYVTSALSAQFKSKF